MKKDSRKFILLVVFTMMFGFMVATAGVGWAQSGNQGSLEGTVVDSSGAAVPNASVSVVNRDNGVSLRTVTTGEGEFKFAIVPVGTYDLTVESSGFGTVNRKEIPVTVGAKVNLPIRLAVSGKTEQVTARK